MASSTVQQESDVSTQQCPECSGDLVQDAHETHCGACGLVVEDDPVDHGPEWRSFDREERKRTGAPRTVTLHDSGLSTDIGTSGADVSSRKRRRLSRQRRLHSRAKFESKRERNLSHGLGEVRRLVGALDQSDAVQQQASTLFKEAQDANLLIGRSIESGATAAVYAAGRCNTVIRMADVVDVARCSSSNAWGTYRTFQRELEIPIPVQLPVDWVPTVISELPVTVSPALRQEATQLAAAATDSAALNGNPIGIAAAAVYLSGMDTDLRLTQETISEAVDISPATVRAWYQRLVEFVDE